jgi:hypothetical protein
MRNYDYFSSTKNDKDADMHLKPGMNAGVREG